MSGESVCLVSQCVHACMCMYPSVRMQECVSGVLQTFCCMCAPAD